MYMYRLFSDDSDNGVRNDESPSLFHSFTPWEVQCRMPWHAIDAGGRWWMVVVFVFLFVFANVLAVRAVWASKASGQQQAH